MSLVRLIIGLILLSSCATKIRVPLNRMMAPETVGGEMNPEFELSMQQQLDGKVDISQTEPYPVTYEPQSAMGYFMGLSLFESLDFTWQHTASAPSMFGFKWQFIGTSLSQTPAGHSMALAGSFGGNEHEIDGNPKVEFTASATDFSLIHGYWFSSFWQIYESVSFASYRYDGELSGSTSGDFVESGKLMTAALGTSLYAKPYRLKGEVAYTQADWSASGKDSYLSFALGLGFVF